MPDFPNDDTQLDASERVRIASAGHTAEFAPAAGGRLTGLSTDGLDWIVPLAETDWPAAKWPRAGSYPLAPYSNRIRDGVFTFDGARHRLRSLAGGPRPSTAAACTCRGRCGRWRPTRSTWCWTRRPGRWVGPGRSNACSAIGWMPAA